MAVWRPLRARGGAAARPGAFVHRAQSCRPPRRVPGSGMRDRRRGRGGRRGGVGHARPTAMSRRSARRCLASPQSARRRGGEAGGGLRPSGAELPPSSARGGVWRARPTARSRRSARRCLASPQSARRRAASAERSSSIGRRAAALRGAWRGRACETDGDVEAVGAGVFIRAFGVAREGPCAACPFPPTSSRQSANRPE